MEDDVMAHDYNEIVTAKLCEWSSRKARLEKKRIQKQKLNQHYREWMKDLVILHPLEVKMLAEDDTEAAKIRKDHAKYLRRAIFDEYTFKKKPLTESEREERTHRDQVRKNTMEIFEQGREEGDDSDEGDDGVFTGLGEKSAPRVKILKNPGWFTRPWLMKLGGSHESICIPHDRDDDVCSKLSWLVKNELENRLKGKVLETVQVLKAGVLFDFIYEKVENMVRTIVERAKNKTATVDHKWLDKLATDSPETLTDQIIDELFQEAPILYFDGIIRKLFVEALHGKLAETIMEKYVKNDSTLVTTRYKRKQINGIIGRELAASDHICTTFQIAEKAAKTIADHVTSVVRFRLDVPGVKSPSTATSVDLKALYENRLAKLKVEAERKARKNLDHLRDPETARKDIDKRHVVVKKYRKEGNCNCTPKGGKQKRFHIPEYKQRINSYFYYKYISDKRKTPGLTLYPKNRQTIKLVCDDRWDCQPVPLEQELRDIPYRFSYAPPFVVRQIKETKSIKPGDHQIICNIVKRLSEKKKVVDTESIAKKIIEGVGSVPYSHSSIDVPSETSGFQLSRQNVPVIKEGWNPPSMRSTTTSLSMPHGIPKAQERTSQYRRDSQSLSKTSTLAKSSSTTENLQMKAASVPKSSSPKIVRHVSRESHIPRAPDLPKYQKHVVEGYQWDMVPITPCRFHPMKKLNTVLKRFETAGGPAALEYHFESRDPPVNVDEMLPVQRFTDSYKQWERDELKNTSQWTRSLNDSRLKRMARFRKLYSKDPVFGFMSNWESSTYKCPQ